MDRHDVQTVRIDPRHSALVGVRNPQRAASESDPGGGSSHLDRTRRVRSWVDPRHGVVIGVGDPEVAAPKGERARAATDPDRAATAEMSGAAPNWAKVGATETLRVEAIHIVIGAIRDPERSCP